MTRELRAFRYDKDPEAITRPDIVPASDLADDTVPPSGLDARSARELPAYPTLPPACDEATVAYAALQRVPTGKRRLSEDPLAAASTSVARSGARLASTAPTVPPPSRMRLRVNPALNLGVRSAVPAEQPEPVVPAVSPPLPPQALPSTESRVFLLGALTVIAAASVGLSLGNGSFGHVIERLQGGSSELAPIATAPVPATPARTRAATVSVNASPASTAPEANPVPVVRFKELPVGAKDAGTEDAQAPSRKRPAGARRH